MSENVFLLQTKEEVAIGAVHLLATSIEEVLGEELIDIVPAYDSIAVFTNASLTALAKRLGSLSDSSVGAQFTPKTMELPICYELGLDWDELSSHSQLSRETIIDIHLTGSYRSLFMGFTPGFVYAEGLDKRLTCPRKESPRPRIQAGSVGIGGSQTGIYSLESPGGWNIIGRTPVRLFDADKSPPSQIEVGSRFTFKRISHQEFEEWES